jgi:hypothetical protein
VTRITRLIPIALASMLIAGCGQAVRSGQTVTPIAASPSPTLPPTPLPTITIRTPPPPTVPPLEHVAPVIPDVALDVELFYGERWLRVGQVVEIENTSSDAWEEAVFNVPIKSVPESFFLDEVEVTIGETIQSGTPDFFGTETVLRIPLPRPLEPGERVTIQMRYRVVVPPVAPTDWPPIGTTGWTPDLIQAGEWYPALVPYVEGEGWHTWRYHPVGDPTVYPLANHTLTARTDPGVTVASGGLVEAEGGVWRFAVERARGVAFVASDRYQMVEGEIDGITLRSYYLPEVPEAGEAALEIAANALALYEELYGPYPYDSLTVAENGFFGGMEYSALITVSDYVYNTYNGGPDSLLTALVAHETAHQWWYGAVGNDQANEPWLDESLAFYSELLYFERYHPELVDWWWYVRVNQYDHYGPVDATIYSYDDSASFIISMYAQAALFTDDLRELMGDEQFFAFLRDYYARYNGQIVTARDYFMTAREHTNVDLTPLLEAYFANPEP